MLLPCDRELGDVPAPSIYSVRLAILALTQIQPLYKFHAISNSTHHNLGAEVAQCDISRELLSTIIATRTTFLGGTSDLICISQSSSVGI